MQRMRDVTGYVGGRQGVIVGNCMWGGKTGGGESPRKKYEPNTHELSGGRGTEKIRGSRVEVGRKANNWNRGRVRCICEESR